MPNAKIVFNAPYDDKRTYHIKVSPFFLAPFFFYLSILIHLDHQLGRTTHRLGNQDDQRQAPGSGPAVWSARPQGIRAHGRLL